MVFSKDQLLCFTDIANFIEKYPDIFRLFVDYFCKTSVPLLSDNELSIPCKRKKLISNNDELVKILKSIFQYLQISSNYFRYTWKWSQLTEKFVNIEDTYVKWLFYQCLCSMTAMSECERNSLLHKYFKHDEIFENYSKYLRIQISKNFISTVAAYKDFTFNSTNALTVVESITSINDILSSSINYEQETVDFVILDSTINNLRKLSAAVASGKAVCLCGPVGCGKTSLVQYLAFKTDRLKKNQFYNVQLGEDVDSKLLLGSYKCSDIPGEFIWQPGILTKAVIEGYWLLFEDIDMAENDVIMLLVSLLEKNVLCVPGFRDNLVPATGFRIFFTQRILNTVSGYFQPNFVAAELLKKFWIQLNIEPLSKSELIKLVEVKFPELKSFAEKMVNVYLLFSASSYSEENLNEKWNVEGRYICTRDFLKWCGRNVISYRKGSRDSIIDIIQNAIDIFCCSIVNEKIRLDATEKISALLGVTKMDAEYHFHNYKPIIELKDNYIIAGKTILKKKTSNLPSNLFRNTKLRFAMTKPACCLIEKISCCLSLSEPLLLIGETGTGKTSVVQLLAEYTENTLIVLNMNEQSDSTDLLGGYKPVNIKYVIGLLRSEFELLFRDLFNVEQNLKFLNHVSNCYNNFWWNKLIVLMKHCKEIAFKRLSVSRNTAQFNLWKRFDRKLSRIEHQLEKNLHFAFSFIEGALIQAVKLGHWVLLDEINLASAETLQCLSSLLEQHGTLSFYEKETYEIVQKHQDFRLLAAMNPATDVGKKQLPIGIRNRFTEFYVDELTDLSDLEKLVACYLHELPVDKINSIARFYLKARELAQNSLSDSTGCKPHYSLRTLCRALSIASANPCGKIHRSLYEAFCLSFHTQLDSRSRVLVENLIYDMLIDKSMKQALLKEDIPEPKPLNSCIYVEKFWVTKGTLRTNVISKYILTPTIKNNLKNLVRIVSLSNYPILVQGDTSVGKTSLILYLASASGNKCLRINNHDHTDLQEYIGAYSADNTTGHLIFKEGILVEAMRNGYWIILDELNLAPSDVLEALNRVLDDNRELYISETQTLIKAHKNFRIFATQNPPGLYSGRKVLSRAFRNRFIELHFGEIPSNELEIILQLKCDMPASYTKKIITVMKDLQMHRKNSAAFAGKQGFITLRDLFRWGERYRLANNSNHHTYYDWDQHIVDEGYIVLAGRVRKSEESEVILETLEKHFKRRVSVDSLFTLSENTSTVTRHILEKITNDAVPGFEHIVWTFNLRRLAVLIGKAIEFKEPILLVGETGCGKTSLCQLIAKIRKQKLFVVNCHQNTESSDFLGGLRPVRNSNENSSKLFEWVDGPLIEAMKTGNMFLADEISLAEDSVLERLNSLLEPERTLLLSEKSNSDSDSGELIEADSSFYFLSTMNPGGDYGKKELSAALRNRLTEIWCTNCDSREDLISIIEHNIKTDLNFGNQEDGSSGIGKCIMDFVEWLQSQNIGKKIMFTIRDLLLWVKFINITTCEKNIDGTFCKLSLSDACIHGSYLVILDRLRALVSEKHLEKIIESKENEAIKFLLDQMETINNDFTISDSIILSHNTSEIKLTTNFFGVDPFYIEKGDQEIKQNDVVNFTFEVKTTNNNLIRLLRSLQLPGRAILLEGSPGVGKTSLIHALAKSAGYDLTRINLSEQTDVSDLFGADLPVDGAKGGVFAWRDGPFLNALKKGHWILLDELNLASQSVLEGLNAVLDHRGELFIPELGKIFKINSSKTKLFACQNPSQQGYARKKLPASFLNRFTQVYVKSFDSEDLLFILHSCYPQISLKILQKMVQFNDVLNKECGVKWGRQGAPWEMNLRDLTRWCQVMKSYSLNNPGRFVSLIYTNRMRSSDDKKQIMLVYEKIFGNEHPIFEISLPFYISLTEVIFGDVSIERKSESIDNMKFGAIVDRENANLILRHQLVILRTLAICVNMNWLAILVGSSGSGKTKLVETLSQLCNEKLYTLSVSSTMDSIDLVGGFEQIDYTRNLEEISNQIEQITIASLKKSLMCQRIDNVKFILNKWENLKNVETNHKLSNNSDQKLIMEEETKLYKSRIEAFLNFLKILEKINYFPEYVLKIKSKLSELKLVVNGVDNLNTGGKFEWIDSIVVKCVREGYWLLIENVNLCSPAVLDRLNSLVEPNGALMLNEKGVDNNGDLVTVAPHPNFRLFFTMNPQYGEISRAMRNRGLEIYVESMDENLDTNIMDLMSVLHYHGLTSHSLIKSLLQVHFQIRSLNMGLDITVNHLFRACFLIVQYLRNKTQSIDRTFENACKEIYVRYRSLNCDQQERISNIITECLQSFDHISCIPPFYMTINTQNLQLNSTFYTVQQQGMLLMFFFKLSHRVPTVNNFNLCDTLFSKVPILDTFKNKFLFTNLSENNLLVCSILKYYEIASGYDARYRHFFVSQVLDSPLVSSEILKLSEDLSLLITKHIVPDDGKSDQKQMYLCWDLKRIPSVLFNNENIADTKYYNKISLLMYYETSKYTSLPLKVSFELQNFDANLYDYSKAYLTDTLPIAGDTVLKDATACQFNQISAELNDFIETVLLHDSILIDDNKVKLFLKFFQLYKRFLDIGRMPFYSKTTFEINNHALSYLKMILKQIMKLIRRFITCELENSPIKESFITEKFLKIISNIEKCEEFSLLRILPFSKRLKYVLGHRNTIEASNYCFKIDEPEYWILFTNRSTLDFENLKNHFNTMFLNFYSKNSKSCDDEENIFYNDSNKKYPLEVIPIFEAFQLKLESNYKNHVLLKYFDGGAGDFSYSNIVCQTATITRQLHFIPEMYSSLIEKPMFVNLVESGLQMHWYFCIFRHIASFASFSYKNYLQVCRLVNPVKENTDFSEHEILLPSHYPVLTVFVSQFLYDDNIRNFIPALYTPGLEDFRTHRLMLSQIKELLWRNSTFLSVSSSSYLYNEMRSVNYLFNFLLESACSILNVDIDDVNVNAKVEMFIINLKKFIISKKTLSSENLSNELIVFINLLSDNLNYLQTTICNDLNNDRNRDDEMWISIGQCHTRIGIIQFLLFSIFDFIDPVVKVQFKISDLSNDIEYASCCLIIEELSQVFTGYNSLFPYKQIFETWLEKSKLKSELISANVTFRKDTSRYFQIRNYVYQFKENVGSSKTIFNLCEEITNCLKNVSSNVTSEAQFVVKKCQTWLQSCDQFTSRMLKEFSEYSDIFIPLVYAVTEACYGIRILMSCLIKAMSVCNHTAVHSNSENIQDIITNLCSFPSNLVNINFNFDLCFSQQIIRITDLNVPKDNSSIVNIKLVKSCLKEYFNLLHVIGNTDRYMNNNVWKNIKKLLDRVVSMWQLQEQKRLEIKNQEESFYEYRTRVLCETKSDEEDDLQMQEFFFPNYNYSEDFQSPCETLEKKENLTDANKNHAITYITEDEVNFIYSVHSNLVETFTYATEIPSTMKSINNNNNNENCFRANVIESFRNRYSIMVAILKDYFALLNESYDSILLPGTLLMCDTVLDSVNLQEICDFYNDSNITEVSAFHHLLFKIRDHTKKLLETWEDNPVLNDIIEVIERIMKFEITSPVYRFLIGADILLKKLHEWEEVACSSVSFSQQYEELVALIFKWRKIEVSYWRNSLKNVLPQMKKDTSKYWFYLYAVFEEFVNKRKDKRDIEELITILQKFIETASVGVFKSKVELLYVFYCFYVNQSRSFKCGELCNVLWNLYFYYNQFHEQVNLQIDNSKKNIEKKLSDFVKIIRWNDINYWSVVRTVEKTHQQLMKYVKEYRKILETPVNINISFVTNNYENNELVTFNRLLYITKFTISSNSHETAKLDIKLLNKSKKLNEKIISHKTYENMLIALNNAVDFVEKDTNFLNQSNIDCSQSSEKQRSQAKFLLQQKRKTISDSFKMLEELGLSYKNGLVICRNQNLLLESIYSKPVDLKYSFRLFHDSLVDRTLINTWEGCHSNYYKTIDKYTRLSFNLRKPHQDLDLRVTDRVKGFANHLLAILINEKNKLTIITKNLHCLKEYELMLRKIFRDSLIICNEELIKFRRNFVNMLFETIYTLRQFLILLDCCPNEKINSLLPTPIVKTDENHSVLNINKDSAEWKDAYNKIILIIANVEKIKNEFFCDATLTCIKNCESILTKTQLDLILNEHNKLDPVLKELTSIKVRFNRNEQNALWNCVVKLESNVEHCIQTALEYKENIVNVNYSDEYLTYCEQHIDKLNKSILIRFQKLFKNYNFDKTENDELCKNENIFDSSHSKEGLLKLINNDVNILNLKNIRNQIRNFVEFMIEKKVCWDIKSKTKISRLFLPLLNQYNLLNTYIVSCYVQSFNVSTKFCCSLFTLFIDLTNKGYCIPRDLLEDLKEENKSKEYNGMGLADGEGIQDVSDQIESQDQLDTIQQKQQDEEIEDKECKEESNGIEVSDDLPGKSQTLQNNEDESEAEDVSEEELDKEMGETEQDADVLDEQIWGSDSEAEEEDDNKTNEINENDLGSANNKDTEICAKDSQTEKSENETCNENQDDDYASNKEINELDQNEEYSNHVDPYQDKQPLLPEIEPLDLPENMNLDNDEQTENITNEEENPYEIIPEKESDLLNDNENCEKENEDTNNTENCEKENQDTNNTENCEEENEDTNNNTNISETDEDAVIDDDKDELNNGADELTDDEAKNNSQDDNNLDESSPLEEKNSNVNKTNDLRNEFGQIGMENADCSKNNPSDQLTQNTEESLQRKSQDMEDTEREGMNQGDKTSTYDRDNKGHPDRYNQGFKNEEKGNRQLKRRHESEKSDINRSLVENKYQLKNKKLKTVNAAENVENEDNEVEFGENKLEYDLYQHVKEVDRNYIETMDAATKEQAEKEPLLVDFDNDYIEEENMDSKKLDEEENISQINNQKKSDNVGNSDVDNEIDNQVMQEFDSQNDAEAATKIDGEYVNTMIVERGLNTDFYTGTKDEQLSKTNYFTSEYIEWLKRNKDTQNEQIFWNQACDFSKDASEWNKHKTNTFNLSQELSEQLRLILEPTKASRLKGDFRTGRRINMRKVIPYIASQFRKDKIWLRRTKLAKRDYQILLAIDNSSSMDFSNSQELAFQSIALVSNALSLIEAGELGIISFGEKTRLVHPLGEPFTTHTGAQIIQHFRFDEIETKVADVVHYCNAIFINSNNMKRTSVKPAQLLIIISDGRCVTSEGVNAVNSAIRTAKQAGIFIVFIITENPKSKNSILDVRLPVFDGDKLIGIQSYIENFPFPYYLILRDIDKLPAVLAEALQQWFQLVANVNY